MTIPAGISIAVTRMVSNSSGPRCFTKSLRPSDMSGSSSFFFVSHAEGARRARLADEAGQHHDGDKIWDHLNELNGNVFGRIPGQLGDALHLNRQGIGKSEQQTGEHRLHRPPLAEDQSS